MKNKEQVKAEMKPPLDEFFERMRRDCKDWGPSR